LSGSLLRATVGIAMYARSNPGRPRRRRDILAACLLAACAAAALLSGVAAREEAPEGPGYAEKAARTVLISLDSCKAGELAPGGIGRLARLLAERGVLFAEARTCLAAETMSGHTSMLTGCTSATTGILGNGLYDPLRGEDIAVVQDSGYRNHATIFEILEGGRPELQSAFVSGKWRLPRFLAQGADDVVASPSSGLPMTPELVARVGRPWRHFEGDLPDAYTLRAATELLRREAPFFSFVNLAWLDRIGHDSGVDNHNRRRALRQLDDLLELFLRDLRRLGMERDTLLVFTSDHGMDSVSRYLNPRRILEEAGVAVRHVHAEGHCAFVYLENPAADLRRALERLGAEDTVEVVLPREELGPLDLDAPRERAGDLFLSCRADTVVRFKNLSLIYPGMHGGLSSQEIVLGFLGPGVEPRPGIHERAPGTPARVLAPAARVPGIEDLAPTLLAWWGMEVPEWMDGEVLDVLP